MAQCIMGSGSFNKFWGTFKVAGLPPTGGSQQVGDGAIVTDATAPAFAAAVAGGGAVICPVFWNGTAWACGG
jgi:hypothetical protein